MLDIFNNFVQFIFNSLGLIIDFIIFLFNFAIWLICGIINVLVSILPTSPFSNINLSFGIEKYLGYLAWLVPIGTILSITLAWGGCMILYYGYSVVMRWIKLID